MRTDGDGEITRERVQLGQHRPRQPQLTVPSCEPLPPSVAGAALKSKLTCVATARWAIHVA
jgi:hypothetical protein